MDGHAEYFDVKENTTVYDDVVCGSVSNLAQVTILGVLEVLKLKPTYMEEGNIALDVSKLPRGNRKITSPTRNDVVRIKKYRN